MLKGLGIEEVTYNLEVTVPFVLLKVEKSASLDVEMRVGS